MCQCQFNFTVSLLSLWVFFVFGGVFFNGGACVEGLWLCYRHGMDNILQKKTQCRAHVDSWNSYIRKNGITPANTALCVWLVARIAS